MNAIRERLLAIAEQCERDDLVGVGIIFTDKVNLALYVEQGESTADHTRDAERLSLMLSNAMMVLSSSKGEAA